MPLFTDMSPYQLPANLPCWYCQNDIKIIPNAYSSKSMAIASHLCNSIKISYILNIIHSDKWRVSSINLDFSSYKIFGDPSDNIADLCILNFSNNQWEYKYVTSIKGFLSLNQLQIKEKAQLYLTLS